MKNKVYLRLTKEVFNLFEGDIQKDAEYWEKYQNQKPRYFLLKEVK